MMLPTPPPLPQEESHVLANETIPQLNADKTGTLEVCGLDGRLGLDRDESIGFEWMSWSIDPNQSHTTVVDRTQSHNRLTL